MGNAKREREREEQNRERERGRQESFDSGGGGRGTRKEEGILWLDVKRGERRGKKKTNTIVKEDECGARKYGQ